MIVLVLLLIFPTLDSHSNSFESYLVLLLIFPILDSHSYSFVSTAWPNDFTCLTVYARPNDFTSRTFNLPHSWLSLLLICIYCLT
jgi:hypothetical protein